MNLGDLAQGKPTMRGFETRFQRLELKYVIDDSTAAQIRRELEPYCREDEHNASPCDLSSAPPGYLVQSLYLDSPSLAFHRAKQRGDAERLKLRVRGYLGREFVAMEHKRRSSDIIEKTRVMVDPDQIEAAALGFGKPLDDGPEARQLLGRFAHLVVSAGAAPTLLIRYWREAYTSRVDDYARVTFDRRVAVQRTRAWDHEGDPARWCELEHHLSAGAPRPIVILELKCRSRVPYWISDLVRRYALRRRSFSKYSIGIHLTASLNGSAGLMPRCGGVLR